MKYISKVFNILPRIIDNSQRKHHLYDASIDKNKPSIIKATSLLQGFIGLCVIQHKVRYILLSSGRITYDTKA